MKRSNFIYFYSMDKICPFTYFENGEALFYIYVKLHIIHIDVHLCIDIDMLWENYILNEVKTLGFETTPTRTID